MQKEFSRTEQLLGKKAMETLAQSYVAVFGIGGVGAYAVEGLARCGVGRFMLVDNDHICLTNINRQIHASSLTVGQPKVTVMRERILSINPLAEVRVSQSFYLPEQTSALVSPEYHYLIDAVDTISAKIGLAVQAKDLSIPMISSMGVGNKIDPSRLTIGDIYSTSVCPLAKVMRRELRKRGIESLKVVYSTEIPTKPGETSDTGAGESCPYANVCPESCTGNNNGQRKQVPGSVSFVPSIAGLMIAGEVVKDLISGAY